MPPTTLSRALAKPALPFSSVMALDDHELLARIVQPPIHDAKAIVNALRHDADFALIEALGLEEAKRLRAAIELGKRLQRSPGARRSLPDPEAVFDWATERLTDLDHEELWALTVDSKNRLRTARRLASGGALGLGVFVREVLCEVLREGAPAFVLVHNHPSGDPEPSGEDLRFTEHVQRAARTVGLVLLDHVVVGTDGYVSLVERCFLEAPDD